MTATTVWTLVSTLGLGAVLLAVVQALIGWLTGRHGREQSAWEQRDAEARARRKLEEALHRTRIAAIEHDVPEDALPAWPVYDTRGSPATRA